MPNSRTYQSIYVSHGVSDNLSRDNLCQYWVQWSVHQLGWSVRQHTKSARLPSLLTQGVNSTRLSIASTRAIVEPQKEASIPSSRSSYVPKSSSVVLSLDPCSLSGAEQHKERVRVVVYNFDFIRIAKPRQAPHYYKPYFGYLSSCIMSHASHVVLDNDHTYTTPRIA